MKKTYLFFLSVIFLFACKHQNEMGITDKIEYDVLIVNTDTMADWWVQNLEGPARENLNALVINAAFSGKYKLYDFKLDELTGRVRHEKIVNVKDIQDKLSAHFSKEMLPDTLTGKMIEKEVMVNTHNPANINKYRFQEKWMIDEQTLQITKLVKGIAPIIETYDDSGSFAGNRLLFYMDIDTTISIDKMKPITTRIQYDVFIKSPVAEQDWWVQNIEQSYKEKLLNLILEKAKTGTVKAYDFPFNNELKPQDVVGILTSTQVTQLQRPYPPYEIFDTTITTTIGIEQLVKIRFLEEWYVSAEPFAIIKKVLGIAPIKENYTSDGTLRGYTPIFWIYFDKKYPIKNK